jgi:UDP-glucose:(heptosyl)LPS alpha-1,3-glucosyltransferase
MTGYTLAFAVAKYFEFGGMQRSFMRIARECARRGHEVHAFTTEWRGTRPQDLTVHVLNSGGLTNHGMYRRFGLAVQRAVAGAGFDCVVGSTKMAGLDVYYAGDPCYVARVDENRPPLYKLLPRYRALHALEAAVFAANADTEVLLIAHQEREKFVRYYGTEATRFHLLPPGIDRDRLLPNRPTAKARAALRAELGLHSDGFMLLNVGARFKTKGIDRVLRALAALPAGTRARTKLVVVGEDDARPFQRLAHALGIGEHLVFTGARQDIAAFYYGADLLVHPAYTENTGTTLIEAMICGLPVLTTANCGFAFHVRNAGAGEVCPLPFAQELLNRLLADMLDHEKLAVWAAKGPDYCARNDLYSLITQAADAIIARATRNRGSRDLYSRGP